MTFSIILPIYKVEKYLHECVDSVLSQTFMDFEVILVDDGSPDSCPQICDEYAAQDERVKVVHKQNGGLSDARNYGMKYASGKYIFFIDSDDYLVNDSVLKTIRDTIKENNEPDVVVFKSIKWFEKDGSFGTCSFDFNISQPSSSFVDTCVQLCDKNAFENQAWTRVVKRSMLESGKIQFQKGLISEDIDWNYQVVLQTNSIAFIDKPLYIYRQRAGSITTTASIRSMESMLWIINKWSAEMTNNSSPGYEIIRNDLARVYCNSIILYCGIVGDTSHYIRLKSFAHLMNVGNNPRVRKFRLMKKCFGFRGLTKLIKLAIWVKQKI